MSGLRQGCARLVKTEIGQKAAVRLTSIMSLPKILISGFTWMEFGRVDKATRSKTGVWKMQEWSEVNKAVYKITRLAETLMSTGGQSSTRIFTVDQTHFVTLVDQDHIN